MSAATRTTTGRLNELAVIAEKLRKSLDLKLRDIFDDTNVGGIGMIHGGLNGYGVECVARVGDLKPLIVLEPFIALFGAGRCRTLWEVNRRAAAAVIMLYLREQANLVSRIRGAQVDSADSVFLGYMLRDCATLRLTELQLAGPQQEDYVVELWASKDDGAIQVWYRSDDVEYLDAGPSDETTNPYILAGRRRYKGWVRQQPS